MITVEMRNKDAKVVAEALRQMRNESRSIAKYDGVSKTQKKKLKHTAKRAEALRGLFIVRGTE